MLYDVEQKTHKLVKKLANQEGVKIKIKKPMIQASEICQILKAFEEILGDNPNWIKEFEELTDIANDLGFDECTQCGTSIFNQTEEKDYSQALCRKWLNYRSDYTRMIDSEPVKVLEELNQILESKIK